MKKPLIIACQTALALSVSTSSFAFDFDFGSDDPNFKRFSISVGLLHATPTGSANPLQNSTVVDPNKSYANGDTAKADLVPAIIDKNMANRINGLPSPTLLKGISGTTKISSLESWSSAGTGLEAADADTLGILLNYHINDNWSIESKAGIPPNVEIKGIGEVYSPVKGRVTPNPISALIGITPFDIEKDIQITDLTQGDGVASTARAWLPAAEVHYQFGKSGVNKFRPYVGLGLIYAYFDNVEINDTLRDDLNIAGQRIQQIKDGKAGAALADKSTYSVSDDIKVEVEATDALAPIATLGATYDINDRVFAVGSVSYAKLNNESIITVTNKEGDELVNSSTQIDIDPMITYLGVGYRF